MPEEPFPLPGSSYDQLVKIISAYANLKDPSSPSDVSKLIGMHATIVSRNNRFLVAVGVLEAGKKKLLTAKGRDLALSLEHNIQQDIVRCWRDLVLANEFLSKLISAVRIRKGMELSTLQAHVAYSAGQPRKSQVMTGAGAVVDILTAAGLLQEEDGKLIEAVGEVESPPNRLHAIDETRRDQEQPPVQIETFPIVTTKLGKKAVALTIQLQIQCSADEIEKLAPKLRAFLKEMSNSNDTEKTEAGE